MADSKEVTREELAAILHGHHTSALPCPGCGAAADGLANTIRALAERRKP